MTTGASLRPIEGAVPRPTLTRSSARGAAAAEGAGGMRASSFLCCHSSARTASRCVFVIGSSARARDETARTAPSTTVSATAVANTPRIDVLLYPRLDDRAPSSHERPWRRRARSRGDVPRDGRNLPARHDDRDRHLLVPPPPNHRAGRAVGETVPPGPSFLPPCRPPQRACTRQPLARFRGSDSLL